MPPLADLAGWTVFTAILSEVRASCATLEAELILSEEVFPLVRRKFSKLLSLVERLRLGVVIWAMLLCDWVFRAGCR